tara:strand:- start:3844 stop:8178 length:4335 start_codon:yes stop_codon:yes gene_type:complete
MAKNVAREHAGGLSREALFTQGLPRNITATSNPGTGDDIDSGYNVGSIWVNVSSDAIYFCADASSGAAVWGLSGSAAVTQIDGLSKSDGNFIVGNGSAWVAESGATARTSLGLGTAAVAATGISNTNVPVFTSGVADNDFLRIDGTSVEGLSAAEVAAAIESSIDAVGTIASGTWEATDIAVAHGGTGASSLTDGGVLLGSGTGAITAMAVLSDGEMIVGDGSTDPVAESGATLRTSIGVGTTDSPQFAGATLASSSASEPILHITNTHAGATSGILRFNKDTASGDDNDVMGTIEFYGTDAAENTHERLAYIDSYLVDSAHGSEAAGLRFYVAENDATLTQGLALTGQADDDGEIDVTLGAGTASTTTIAGTLTMGSTAALTNAGLVAVANQSGITGLGTISSGTWEATDVAIAHGGTGASSAGDARTNLGLGTAATASTGISNTNVPVFTTGVADDDFLRVAGTSIEGRSASEVLSDIGASAAAGSSSIATVGTVTSGTWEGSAIGVAYGGTGATSLTSNALLTGNGTSAVQAESTLTFTGDVLTATSTSADLPMIELTNTHAGATAGKIRFNKDSASGADNDVMGTIEWYGTDDDDNTHEKLAYIDSYIIDSAHGSEAAGLRFYVAENDATNTLGLQILGQADDDGEVDIVLGAGAASTTTIAGTLTMGSTAAMTNAGLVSVANQSNITGLGTISSGTWEATDVAVAHGGTGASTLTANGVLIGNGTSAVTAVDMSTKGKLLVGDGSGNPQALSVGGSDDHVLTVDSSEATGMKWAAVSAGAATSLAATSASANQPIVTIENTHADATAGFLKFIKDPGSGQGADNDILGTITFYGTDASNNAPEELARIESYIVEADHGSEAGGMKFYVAENDATMTAGLQILGQASDDGEIDVTIGAGAASTTTIAGTLTMGSTAAMTNAGLLSVANQSNITGLGTISSGVWEGTDVAVAHGGTGASSLTDNAVLTGTGTSAITAESTLSFTGDVLTASSTSADLPMIELTNTHAGATAGKIRFNKDSASGDDNDVMGSIEFYGTDAGENTHERLAYMDSYIIDSAHGSEAAGLRFYVAENDATLTQGLAILGQADDDGEVDVTIGAGAASTTTIAGTLTMGSTAALTNAGLVAVANQSNITGVGTISSGTWEGTTIAVAQGGTGATSLTSNALLTGNSTSAIQAESNLTYTGDTLSTTSSSANLPIIELTNTHADATSGIIKFIKDPGSGQGADNDTIGTLTFYGTDASNNSPEELARMEAYVIEADHGSEAGGIKFSVAENDATMTAGLQILGVKDADGEIDVTIGAGAASTTTIAGTLTMGSTAAMTNAGLVSVANQSNITGLGTISSGTWEATDVAVAHGGTGASTLTANGVLIGNGTSAVTAVDLSTKGHILVGDGSGNPQGLAVGGTDGHVLTVDSSEATGLKYAAASGGASTGFAIAMAMVF